MRKRATTHNQHLLSIVDHRRIAAALDDDREQIADVLAEQFGFEEGLSRFHPVDVPAQRVDLAVMRDVPERVSKRPTRECVRAEALMHDGKRRRDSRIGQIREVNFDLLRREHSFVDDRARGETGEVEFGSEFFDSLPNQVKLSFEFVNALDVGIAPDEDLLEHRLDGLCRLAYR